MCVYVCVYVCVHVCIGACVCLFMRVSGEEGTCVRVYVHVCMRCVRACIFVRVHVCVYLRRCTCLVGIRNSFGDPSQPGGRFPVSHLDAGVVSPLLPPPPPRLGERALESISFEDRMCDICDGLDVDISDCKDDLGISLGAANPVLGAAGKFLKSQVCSDFLRQMQY